MKSLCSLAISAIIPFLASCSTSQSVTSTGNKNQKAKNTVEIDGGREIVLKPTIKESLEVLKKHGFRVPSTFSNANVVVAVKNYEVPFTYTDENGISILVNWQDVQFMRPEGSETKKIGFWGTGYYTDQE